MKLKRVLQIILSLLIGMAGCLGPGDTTTFESKSIQVGGSGGLSQKTWRNAQLLDFGAIDVASTALNHDNNLDLSGLLWKFPMAVFSVGLKDFHVVFNRADDVPTGFVQNVFAQATTPVFFDSDLWGSSLNSFTRIDFSGSVLSPGADSQRPLSVVDSVGNAYVVMFTPITENATTHRRPLVARRNGTTKAWEIPSRVTKLTETGDVLLSAAMAADPFNNIAIVFRQNASNYVNVYRPFLGWRYPAGSVGHATWHDTAGGFVPLDLGMDIGFDGYGNGYATYISSSATFGTVKIVRWKGDNPANFVTADLDTYQTLSVPAAADDRFPRLAVYNSGGADIFFYRNFNGTTEAELWVSSAADTTSSTAAAFSADFRLDSAVGVGNVIMVDSTLNDVLPPIVAVSGNTAAYGFIKSDGGSNRFFVARRRNGSWFAPTAIDSGSGNVTWGSLAVNGRGDIVAAWSSIGTDTFEHVYGSVFEAVQNGWGTIVQLDSTSSYVLSASATEKSRPSVSIDSDGNGLVTFTMSDSTSLFAPVRRRALAVSFR